MRVVCPQPIFRAEHTVELLPDGTTARHYWTPGITLLCPGSNQKTSPPPTTEGETR